MCHEGDFFKGSVAESCNVCDKKFSKEPGFYQGSYYVTYALGVAIFITIWVVSKVLFSAMTMSTLAIAIVSVIILLAPFTYYLSKIIWANLFFHYKKATINERTSS